MGIDEQTDYIVYMHVFPNGKKYIGITKNLKNRFGKNGKGYIKNKSMYDDIMKFGWGNIEHKILQSNLSKFKARQVEQKYIKQFDTIANGYNLSESGISKQVILYQQRRLTWTHH